MLCISFKKLHGLRATNSGRSTRGDPAKTGCGRRFAPPWRTLGACPAALRPNNSLRSLAPRGRGEDQARAERRATPPGARPEFGKRRREASPFAQGAGIAGAPVPFVRRASWVPGGAALLVAFGDPDVVGATQFLVLGSGARHYLAVPAKGVPLLTIDTTRITSSAWSMVIGNFLRSRIEA